MIRIAAVLVIILVLGCAAKNYSAMTDAELIREYQTLNARAAIYEAHSLNLTTRPVWSMNQAISDGLAAGIVSQFGKRARDKQLEVLNEMMRRGLIGR